MQLLKVNLSGLIIRNIKIIFLGLASGLKSILTNAVEIGYPRSLFVRRTVDARANRPMKDMIHWVLYEELRFIMTGDQMESELQHQLNAFLGKYIIY